MLILSAVRMSQAVFAVLFVEMIGPVQAFNLYVEHPQYRRFTQHMASIIG